MSRVAVDLEEVIWEGLSKVYEGRDLYEAAFVTIDDLKHYSGGEVSKQLRNRLSDTEKQSVIEAGLCPHCGRELEECEEGFEVDGPGGTSTATKTHMICWVCDL